MNWRETYKLLKEVRTRSDSLVWEKIFNESHHLSLDALLNEVRAAVEACAASADSNRDASAQDRLRKWRGDYQAVLTSERQKAESAFDTLKGLRNQFGVLEGPYHAASVLIATRGGHWSLAPASPRMRPTALPDNGPRVYRGDSICNLTIDDRNGVSWRTLTHLYRGVNSVALPLVPPILRNFEDQNMGVSPEIVDRRYDRLDAFRFYLRRHFDESERFIGSADDADAALFELAFAQHFKGEAHVLTPMLDFTYDPLVALFFASYGRPEDGTGVIYCLSIEADIQEFSDFGVGEVLMIDLPAVSRLRRQCGVLLHGSAPGSLQQLVPYELRFEQTGEVFEDLELGIDETQLLHIEPEVQRFVTSFQPGEGLSRNQVIYVDKQSLRNGLLRRLRKFHTELAIKDAMPLLERLVEFHHMLALDPELPPRFHSFRTLIRAAYGCLAQPSGSASGLIRDVYLERLFGPSEITSNAQQRALAAWQSIET